MKTTTILLKVLPEKQEEFEALVSQLVKDVNANEPDPKIYEVRKCQDDPLSYFYFFCFADDVSEANAFFNRYAKFRNNYIHLSHNPFNSTIGMMSQLKKRNKKAAVEKAINDVTPANKLDKIYKRDIFLNSKRQVTYKLN